MLGLKFDEGIDTCEHLELESKLVHEDGLHGSHLSLSRIKKAV